MNTSVNSWKGAAQGNGECAGHLCAFSQAAKTMCSSLQRYAGPLSESRDY